MCLHAPRNTAQISVGLYHTAGKGTRLAPMPGSENNNKPGVKLAVTADINGKPCPLTILESVVKQTGVYGKSRKGRLSVFWGDQVHFLFLFCSSLFCCFWLRGRCCVFLMQSFVTAGMPQVPLICFRITFIGAMRRYVYTMSRWDGGVCLLYQSVELNERAACC